MAICGTGIDIAENERFEKMLVAGDMAFFHRVFSPHEREYCDKYRTPRMQAQHYAARFAAKEAFVKALGTGFRQMNFHDVEVHNDALGAPFLEISGKAAELLQERQAKRIHLSLSHSDNYSVAMVVVEKEE